MPATNVDSLVAALASLDGSVSAWVSTCLDRLVLLQRELEAWHAVGRQIEDVQRALDAVEGGMVRDNSPVVAGVKRSSESHAGVKSQDSSSYRPEAPGTNGTANLNPDRNPNANTKGEHQP
jgi:hypothetical protein